MPSHLSQTFDDVFVTLPVTLNLSLPELCVCFWHAEQPAILMAMPEAAVDENHSAILAHDDIGMARQTRMA